MTLLDEKVALERKWTRLYKKNGLYTVEMIPLTTRISDLTKKIINHDQEEMRKRLHNQA
jgi:hypothetical protein|tara:strand:- start:2232 stop:2408 length:177 start_codon:yes stop_codon:yes gene_type:complete